ncbi:MAG: OsmC family protein, partial [Desulfuromonadales bacterium]
MLGTFARVLANKKIETPAESFQAEVEGDIENVDGVLKITEIRVHYQLTLDRDQEDDARWAFDHYLDKCPGAMSVEGCIR